jgi:glycosyltransferase involved in cell wall biosynthesis
LEAGACGLPVVSTTLGAEGIPVTHNRDIFLADEPDEFAYYIVQSIKNRENAGQMGGKLRQLVKENFSIDALVQEGEAILSRLLTEPGHRT